MDNGAGSGRTGAKVQGNRSAKGRPRWTHV